MHTSVRVRLLVVRLLFSPVSLCVREREGDDVLVPIPFFLSYVGFLEIGRLAPRASPAMHRSGRKPITTPTCHGRERRICAMSNGICCTQFWERMFSVFEPSSRCEQRIAHGKPAKLNPKSNNTQVKDDDT